MSFKAFNKVCLLKSLVSMELKWLLREVEVELDARALPLEGANASALDATIAMMAAAKVFMVVID